MNQAQPTKQKKVVNTLSVRLPPEIYNKVANMALDRGATLNSVFIELVEIGLNGKIKEQEILDDFIFSVVSPERLRELIHGKSKSSVTT